MRIKSLEVEGLLGRPEPIKYKFDNDLNILTGRNGAGKTTVLKLIWSIISGNILIGIEEVNFHRATVITSAYECTVWRLGRRTCKVDLLIGDQRYIFEDSMDVDGDIFENAEDKANERLRNFGRSVFFPTFRRIEGGFTTNPTRPNSGEVFRQNRARSDLEEALSALSRNLTHDPHIFVSAISTADIVTLLLRKYADLSEDASRLQARTSQEIIQRIRDFRPLGNQADQLDNATATLEEVRSRIEAMEHQRANIMSPLTEVRQLVEHIFQHAGISFGPRMKFGDAARAVNSDTLSAGEKQMLSFVCYNAFYKDAAIFIDEPELSLHVDWQRSLFPTLERQNSENQFFVATHSPFIYGKYPDKEIEIIDDRGDTRSDGD